jgi:hypothetical protein
MSTVYYRTIRAQIDPDQSEMFAGRRVQDVTILLTGNYGKHFGDTPPERPAAIVLEPADVRGLAAELLELAAQAEEMSTPR